MGAFRGYFDESGKDAQPHNALALCGYVCTLDGWKAFERAWQAALNANGAPYLHMKELQDPKGPLGKFAGKENQEACAKLLGDLIGVIAQSNLTCAGSLIRLPDLKEFNSKFGLSLEPLPLAIYDTMLELYRLYPDDTLELIIDRGLEKPEKTIALGIEYAASHVHDDVSERMSWTPLKGNNSFRNVLPIQAADFAVWEARKEHELKNDWWKNNKRGLPSNDWVASVTEWLSTRGKAWPGHRRSFAGLTKATKMHASVLDYDALCKIHEARYGVWTIEARDHYRRELVFGKSS